MNPTHDADRRTAVPAVLFSLIAVLVVVDLVEDRGAGIGFVHLSVELGMMAAAVIGAVLLWREWQRARGRALRLVGDLEVAKRDGERWRNEAEELLRGLGIAIDMQFERWGLTSAEREVGLLLLKGLSLKEVAAVRGTSERTARQQAFALYGKAGLSGRAELSAFFLEDLLLPQEPMDPDR